MEGIREAPAERHPFVRRPHRTLLALSLPVLLSLVVEPLTGLVDTLFVARLGAGPLAALGAGATLLSSFFWIFNFLGIGTQTEVAHGLGRDADDRREAASLALALALAIGAGFALLGWPALGLAAGFMSDQPQMREAIEAYLAVRLLGAPGVLLMLAGFGALRGLQEMRTPLWIAASANLVNAACDPLLIFGWGPLPALGLAGAAWASTLGHWIGGVWAVAAVRARLGLASRVPWSRAPALLVVARDLLLRTGLLTLFLLLATRAATQLGAEAGAAHQVVRQVWLLAAFLLDAFAATAQSLVAFFLGAGRKALARRVAAVACGWGVAAGVAIGAAMLTSESALARALLPASAAAIFSGAWWVLALTQPLNALSFVTDGIHWGARDYRYLRNAMLVSSASGGALLLTLPGSGDAALTLVWLVTALWIALRAGFGVLRIWPGFGAAPLAAPKPG